MLLLCDYCVYSIVSALCVCVCVCCIYSVADCGCILFEVYGIVWILCLKCVEVVWITCV